MSSITIKTSGSKDTMRMFTKLRRQYPGAFSAALFQKGLEIFSDSQEEVPVDTGRLRASGAVYPPTNFFSPVVVIAYGTTYALPVHEILPGSGGRWGKGARHGPTVGRGTGQKAKYLEDPFKRAMNGFSGDMIRKFRRNIMLHIWDYPSQPEKGSRGPNAKTKRRKRRRKK